MSDRSLNGYKDQGSGVSASYWFAGSTAVKEGQGFCYNWDKGTATAALTERGRDVEVPTILNAPYFAGVSKCAYPANASGQYVELWLPGSVCNIWILADTVIGVGRLTCQAGGANAGLFSEEGFPGKGSAVPLQTLTASTGKVCTALLDEGAQSGLQEILTWTGAEAEAKVIMVGGVTHIIGSTSSGAKTFVLADGTYVGQQKGFVVDTALTSEALTVTPTSPGLKRDGSTAITTLVIGAANDYLVAEWGGLHAVATWSTKAFLGGAIEA